jgi:hypothetical protein
MPPPSKGKVSAPVCPPQMAAPSKRAKGRVAVASPQTASFPGGKSSAGKTY